VEGPVELVPGQQEAPMRFEVQVEQRLPLAPRALAAEQRLAALGRAVDGLDAEVVPGRAVERDDDRPVAHGLADGGGDGGQEGAVPCSMWRDAFEELRLPAGALSDGGQVVVAGGPDYYAGSRTASPSFSFAVSGLRLAGEGDLLAQVEVLRRTLAAEGLFEPQKRLARPALPRCIGGVTRESGKARDDVLAGLRRRGWAGRVLWAFAPVQDRHAAPAITR